MDGPPSFTSVVARPYVELSDTSYNNEHAPPSLGSLAMAQLQLSDPFTVNYYNNEPAVSMESVAMAQLQLSDPFTDYSYNNEPAISMESVAMIKLQLSLDQLTDDASYSNEQAPSMSYGRGVSQSASDGFSYNAPPPSLTDVAGRVESYSVGPGSMDIDSNSASMYEIPEIHTGKTPATAVKGQRAYKRRRTIDSITKFSDTIEDGYAWRKYGQKEILNDKFPICYFRCTYRIEKGCKAIKQVQRSNNDPYTFQITYFGHHTCTPSNTSHLGVGHDLQL